MNVANVRIARLGGWLLTSLTLSSVVGCTWVALDDAGRRIRVAESAANVEGCVSKDEITASVRDKVAFVDREPAKVADEVEALARNEAAQRGADTILPLGPVKDGERVFQSYRCK